MDINKEVVAFKVEDEPVEDVKSAHANIMMKPNMFRALWEKTVEFLFLICAFIAVLSVGTICYFIFVKGTPAILGIGVWDFIWGMDWSPSAEAYGIRAIIMGSLFATLGAILIGVPIGIFTAIFMAEIAPAWLVKIVRPAVELLAGIPSVVYGFFGLVIIVPLIDKIDDHFGGGSGYSLLAASFILGVMILPTIVSISETSIRAVPDAYKEGSLAMGASHIQTIFKVLLPAAKSGIFAAIVLGIGRAIGETMAVILVAGNTVQIPWTPFERLRTMTATIAMEMGYATEMHQNVLFGIGVVLFVFIMLLNIILNLFSYRAGD